MLRRIRLWVSLLPLAFGCGGERPACSPVELARLDTEYAASVLRACDGYATPEECPAYPGLRDGYRQKREEWVRCQ